MDNEAGLMPGPRDWNDLYCNVRAPTYGYNACTVMSVRLPMATTLVLTFRFWKSRSETGQKWDPAQREVPRPETITEAMERSQKGTNHDHTPRRPNKQLKESDAGICTQPMDRR